MPNVLFSGVYYIGQQGRPQRSAVTDVEESNVTAGMLVAIHPEDTLEYVLLYYYVAKVISVDRQKPSVDWMQAAYTTNTPWKPWNVRIRRTNPYTDMVDTT